MTRSPLLALVLVSQACLASFLPDTGVVAQAIGYSTNTHQFLRLRIVNQSHSARAGLGVRIHLDGDSADLADFAFRSDTTILIRADGFTSLVSSSALESSISNATTRPMVPGCQVACRISIDLPLTGITLEPLQSIQIDLAVDKFQLPGTSHLGTNPTHSLSTTDWSMAGVPVSGDPNDPAFLRGEGPIARHIQILSNDGVVWGSGPALPESPLPSPWKRSGLTTTIDAIETPFPDSASQRTRDSANLRMSRLLVNQAGYRVVDLRAGRAWVKAIGPSATTFSVINAAGEVLGQGTLVSMAVAASGQIKASGSYWAGRVSGGDKAYTMLSGKRSGTLHQGRLPSNLPAGGPYRIVAGVDTSARFRVDDHTYDLLRDASLRFFGAQRSGNADSWIHGPSHVDDPAPGGWYDCGDHLKEAQTQGYAMAVLGVLAATHPERDADRTAYNHDTSRTTDGIPDLLRELKHGTDYVTTSWLKNGASPKSLVTSVGDFGKDHSGWFPSDWSALLPATRGGQASRIARIDTGADVQAKYAAGLAFFAGLWKSRDAVQADQALQIAKSLYAAAKSHPDATSSSPAYNGSSYSNDELAVAAVALLWATADVSYLDDLAYNTTLGSRGSTFFQSSFAGGWLARVNHSLTKGSANLDWSNLHPLALYALHRLILRDSATASKYGVRSEAERLALEEHTVLTAASNLSGISVGASSANTIVLPGDIAGSTSNLASDSAWQIMFTQQAWCWNRYLAGDIAEVAMYAEIASDVQGHRLATTTETTEWQPSRTLALALRQMDYLLGVNPWDLSMVYGIGQKTPNHPHHRNANPEGRSIPTLAYTYTAPIGALAGGYPPSTELFDEYWNDYQHSEICLDGSANLLIPAVLLSRDSVGPTSTRYLVPQQEASRFNLSKSTNGIRIRWMNGTGAMDAKVLDISGRTVALFATELANGSSEIELPRTRAPLFLRIHDATGSKTLPIPRF